jgi:hypothetical protein
MNKVATLNFKPLHFLYHSSLFCLLALCLVSVAPIVAATDISNLQGAGIITVGSGVDCDYATLPQAVFFASSSNTILMTNETFGAGGQLT